MSCVWYGLIKKLKLKYKPLTLYNFIKINNRKTLNVMCNGTFPTETQLIENYERIEKLNQNEVQNGYNCSTFDPLIFLISELYKVNIIHNYNGVIIRYEYIENDNINKEKVKIKRKKDGKIKTIKCYSDEGHFW